ncbi:MAG: D-tyrosyl-tRNA(Tyr) deacylase [Synergistetes bacterium]|nr:D-tyrosyl-tRNA(Tyr) deacylase [Synergistota bacterium]
MRAVIQRVKYASVEVDNKTVSEICNGIAVLLGVSKKDTEDDVKYTAEKIVNLRIFEDKEGKMNLSLKEIGGEILIVSQFTLYGDTRKGRRPSFIEAANYEDGKKLFNKFVSFVKEIYSGKVVTGIYGANMLVKIHNDGPVTIIIDTASR